MPFMQLVVVKQIAMKLKEKYLICQRVLAGILKVPGSPLQGLFYLGDESCLCRWNKTDVNTEQDPDQCWLALWSVLMWADSYCSQARHGSVQTLWSCRLFQPEQEKKGMGEWGGWGVGGWGYHLLHGSHLNVWQSQRRLDKARCILSWLLWRR